MTEEEKRKRIAPRQISDRCTLFVCLCVSCEQQNRASMRMPHYTHEYSARLQGSKKQKRTQRTEDRVTKAEETMKCVIVHER